MFQRCMDVLSVARGQVFHDVLNTRNMLESLLCGSLENLSCQRKGVKAWIGACSFTPSGLDSCSGGTKGSHSTLHSLKRQAGFWFRSNSFGSWAIALAVPTLGSVFWRDGSGSPGFRFRFASSCILNFVLSTCVLPLHRK